MEKLTKEQLNQLAGIDNMPVEWAGRDECGNLFLKGNIFKVVITPPPMFGQNARDFGFETALEISENQDVPEHDFGSCFIRDGSLRRESDGRWYVDLSVDPGKTRFHPVTTVLLDRETGEPLLDDDGNEQLRTAPRKESWIKVELSTIAVDLEHQFCAVYKQNDRRTIALMRSANKSAALTEKGERGGGKATRKKLSPIEHAAILAKMAKAGA